MTAAKGKLVIPQFKFTGIDSTTAVPGSYIRKIVTTIKNLSYGYIHICGGSALGSTFLSSIFLSKVVTQKVEFFLNGKLRSAILSH
ncbi:MAG TPA: hypothetical protein DCE41_29815 [Cytophagales bacterium]|nr:hypothetical protein [Cytophagales bacterium]HAA19181.1 hypothetical protein [Cytophagales bacterium]HAP58870.1 hypothetical protein [Cytophagales bacterium]